jgi:hypothetical protein
MGVCLLFVSHLLVDKLENASEQPRLADRQREAPIKPVTQAPALAQLNDPSRSALEDVKLLHELLDNYLQVSKVSRRPLGLNEDVVVAWTTPGRFGVRFMNPRHPAIVDGALVDRWGHRYHFHPLSAEEFEVRSAGPDGQLFTADDLVKGPPEDLTFAGVF